MSGLKIPAQLDHQIVADVSNPLATGQKTTVIMNQPDASTGQLKTPVNESTPDSLWSNFWYGFGMLVAVVCPLLIPGISTRGLVIGYMATTVVIYTLVCIMAIVKSLQSSKSSTSRRGRKY
jgi:hypothetical protein